MPEYCMTISIIKLNDILTVFLKWNQISENV